MKKLKFEVPPKTGIVDVLSNTSGTTGQRLMELIDNSYDAMFDYEDGEQIIKSQTIEIKFDKIKQGPHKGKLGWLISDKASGILNPSTVWIYGESKKKKNLGKFGVGLKIAASALGNIVWIETSTQGEAKKTVIKYDHLDFIQKNKWETDGYEEDEDRKKHYTVIYITDLKDEEPNIETIRNDLARTYYKLIDKNVKIKFQDKFLKWKKPNIYKNEDLKYIREEYGLPETPKYNEVYSEFDIYLIDRNKIEHKIKGWIGITKEDKPEFYGIDIFRAKRLIESSSNLGIGLGTKKIYGQMELGYDFPINFHKTGIIRSEPIVKDLDKELENVTKLVVNIAKYLDSNKAWKSHATVKKLNNISNDFLSDVLNKELSKWLKDLMDEGTVYKKSKDENNNIGEINIDTTPELSEKEKKKVKKAAITRPKTRKPPSSFRDPITGETIKFEHMETSLGEELHLSSHAITRSTLVTMTNVAHPLYQEYLKLFNKKQIHQLNLDNKIFEIAKYIGEKHSIDRDDLRDKIYRFFSKKDLSKLK